ncbi:hypothetical protein GCM10019016_127610 [Streptomyces prasinosporus]|uniref:Uncharacterized protein n=1 Tax=Streptomyces prasinosporus TaxID=68256 RepID=A0ABP6U9W6_9ACTN
MRSVQTVPAVPHYAALATCLEDLRQRARIKDRGVRPRLQAPSKENIRTNSDLTAALVAVYENTGALPLRTIQRRAGTVPPHPGAPTHREVFRLPLSILSRIVRRQIKLPAWTHCEAFLRGCGVPAREMSGWQEAWQRIAVGRPAARDRFPTRHPLTRRGRALSDLITWTPEMEKSAMTLMQALAFAQDTLRPKAERSVTAAVKALAAAQGTLRPEMERSATAAVKTLEVLVSSPGVQVQHAALTQNLAYAVEAMARLNGTVPSSFHHGQLDPMRG